MPKGTVLLIEDNKDILDATRLLLELEGFKVITAENGFRALERLAVHRPDVILTDLMMPEMTGLEFIHEVRRIPDYDTIPIIAISAYDKTYLAAAIVAGAVTALHKPEDLDTLVDTVKEVLPKAA
jgi:two-component system, OmpR family, response regulator VicR